MHPDQVRHFCELSLRNLSLSYLDLYLIHLPVGIKHSTDEELFTCTADGRVAVDCGTDVTAVWKEMEKLVEEGLVKNIGLSNFNEDQVQSIVEFATIKPAMLQIEVHAYFQQMDIRMLCKELGIPVTAYCPLGMSFSYLSSRCIVETHDSFLQVLQIETHSCSANQIARSQECYLILKLLVWLNGARERQLKSFYDKWSRNA